jgi:hypothetical protein
MPMRPNSTGPRKMRAPRNRDSAATRERQRARRFRQAERDSAQAALSAPTEE